jgi:hypothetical protein
MSIQRLIRRIRESAEPRTDDVPSQVNLGSIEVDVSRTGQGATIASFEIESDCLVVGAIPIGRDGALTCELRAIATDRHLKITVFLPPGTERVDFRNASQVSLPGRFRVKSVSYREFEDLQDIGQDVVEAMAQKARKLIFIHSYGKTGSHTLHHAMFPLRNVVRMIMHFVNYPILQGDSTLSPWQLSAITPHGLMSARIIMSLIKRYGSKPGVMDVITGVRRSETLLVASLFQNYGDLFVEFGLSEDEVIKFIYSLADDPDGYATWWRDECFRTYGLTLDDLKSGLRQEGLTRTFLTSTGRLHRFFRIEDGEQALREILQPYASYAERPGDFPGSIPYANAAADKKHASLYASVKEKLDFDFLRKHRLPLSREIDSLFYD